MSSDSKADANQSVARALSVLDVIAAQGELGIRDVARRLDLAPSITHRLVSTLTSYGYLEQSSTNERYRIGHRAFRVGSAFLEQGDLGRLVAPELSRLAEHQFINGFLGVRRGREVVYLSSVQSRGAIVISHPPGAVTHLHSTALGKVLLSDHSDTEIARILGTPPFQKLTERTHTTLPPLIADIRAVRAGAPAISNGENFDTIYAVGAALRNARGEMVAAISGALPLHDLDRTGKLQLAASVKEAADRISMRMGASLAERAGSGRNPDTRPSRATGIMHNTVTE